MKKLIRKMFRIKKQVKSVRKNVYVGAKTLQKIKQWESMQSEEIIRCSFNRDLYYQYLEKIRS